MIRRNLVVLVLFFFAFVVVCSSEEITKEKARLVAENFLISKIRK